MIDLEHWREAQKSEASFWGQCLNTYGRNQAIHILRQDGLQALP